MKDKTIVWYAYCIFIFMVVVNLMFISFQILQKTSSDEIKTDTNKQERNNFQCKTCKHKNNNDDEQDEKEDDEVTKETPGEKTDTNSIEEVINEETTEQVQDESNKKIEILSDKTKTNSGKEVIDDKEITEDKEPSEGTQNKEDKEDKAPTELNVQTGDKEPSEPTENKETIVQQTKVCESCKGSSSSLNVPVSFLTNLCQNKEQLSLINSHNNNFQMFLSQENFLTDFLAAWKFPKNSLMDLVLQKYSPQFFALIFYNFFFEVLNIVKDPKISMNLKYLTCRDTLKLVYSTLKDDFKLEHKFLIKDHFDENLANMKSETKYRLVFLIYLTGRKFKETINNCGVKTVTYIFDNLVEISLSDYLHWKKFATSQKWYNELTEQLLENAVLSFVKQDVLLKSPEQYNIEFTTLDFFLFAANNLRLITGLSL